MSLLTLLGIAFLLGGAWQLATVWKPTLYPRYKLFGVSSTAFAFSKRVRIIWGTSSGVIGLILLVLGWGAPATDLWSIAGISPPAHINHHDTARTIPAGYTDHVDAAINVEVALPDSWTFGHEGTALVGDSPKSTIPGSWAFVSIYRVKERNSLSQLLQTKESPSETQVIVDKAVTSRVAIPAGDAVKSSWTYALRSDRSRVAWITLYFLPEGDFTYVVTLSGGRASQQQFEPQILEILNSFRILP